MKNKKIHSFLIFLGILIVFGVLGFSSKAEAFSCKYDCAGAGCVDFNEGEACALAGQPCPGSITIGCHDRNGNWIIVNCPKKNDWGSDCCCNGQGTCCGGGGGGGGERVVGRVTVEGQACTFFTNLTITSSDGKVASWGYNEGGNCGPTAPYFAIGRWPAGSTVTITLSPPSGYRCNRWFFDSHPEDGPSPTAGGSGCTATVTLGSGPYSSDWQNHLWFYLMPSCQNQCTPGTKRCYDDKRFQRCEDINGDGCYEWTNPEDCPIPTIPPEYFCRGNLVVEKSPKPVCRGEGVCGTEWVERVIEDCGAQGKICMDGRCIPPPTCEPINAYVEPNPVRQNQTVTFIFTSNRGYTYVGLNANGGLADCQLDLINSAKCGNNPKDGNRCWWKWICRATTPGSFTATFTNAENCPKSVNFTVLPRPPSVITKGVIVTY